MDAALRWLDLILDRWTGGAVVGRSLGRPSCSRRRGAVAASEQASHLGLSQGDVVLVGLDAGTAVLGLVLNLARGRDRAEPSRRGAASARGRRAARNTTALTMVVAA